MEVLAFALSDREARRQYDELFASSPQAFVQQSTQWAEAIGALGPDEPIFLLAVSEGVAVGALPLYLFRGPAGSILNSVPQAGPLGGVFVRPGCAPETVYAALLDRAERVAAERGCIAMTIITSPFANDLALYERHLAPDLVFENFTQIVDIEKVIRQGDWILANNAERNPGRTLRKATAAGLKSKIADQPHEFEEWYGVHRRRHGELKLNPLPFSLLDSLRAVLAPRNMAFLQLVTAQDQIAAGCLFVHHRDVCDAFIMSMDSTHAAKAPNYLLVEQALFTMWRRGIRYMNWQSSPRRGDGVYNFKKQWGSEERPYWFVTKIYCPAETILSLGADGVRSGYPGHYVVPFGVFEKGVEQRVYRKP